MVNGIGIFKKYFEAYYESYRIIGGCACSLLLDDMDLDFRVTKDIDIVICTELIEMDFVNQLWEFLNEGGYKIRLKSTGKPNFYRFANPSDGSYPYMLEILAGEHNLDYEVEPGSKVPIVIDDEIVSLSAMLMDKALYEFILKNSIVIDGVPICDEYGLIALKAAAWRNLTIDKKNGLEVKSRDIIKHKNDILRLCQILVKKKLELSDYIRSSVSYYIENVEFDTNTLKNIGISNIEKDTIVSLLREVYVEGFKG